MYKEKTPSNRHPLLFVVFTCDETKAPESRHLAFSAVRSSHVQQYVAKLICQGKVTYTNPNPEPVMEENQADIVSAYAAATSPFIDGIPTESITQLKAFLQDWYSPCLRKKDLNVHLHGCVLDTAIAGHEYHPMEKRGDYPNEQAFLPCSREEAV